MVRVQRVLAPSPMPGTSRYPRWGYLDKFSEQEYLARSVAVTLLCIAAASAVLHLVPSTHRQRDLAPQTRSFSIPIHPLPPPSILPTPPPAPVPRPVHPADAVRGRPIPADVPEDRTLAGDEGAAGPESGPPGGAEGATGEGEFTAGGGGAGVLPGPDEFIPVERVPRLLEIEPPDYPELAREAGTEGRVTLAVLVGADGSVVQAHVADSVLGLDEAALAAVQRAVFEPALQQGKAVAAWVVIPIEFALRGR